MSENQEEVTEEIPKMQIKAFGRYLHIRVDFDMIEALVNSSQIAFPKEYLDKLKGGCQVATILSAGGSAFDDATPEEQELMRMPGRQVLTGRYPGHELDLDPRASDKEVNRERLISCDEVHAFIPLDGDTDV